jgi:hypothetical protein
MPKAARPAHIRALPRSVGDLTDSQIETFIRFGREEAQLIDELEAAVRTGDRDAAWRIAQALCRIEDEARRT